MAARRSCKIGIPFVVMLLVCAGAFAREQERGYDRDQDRDRNRRDALQRMRVAAADRLIEDKSELEAYLAAGFNTIVLYDAEESGLPKSEERIAYESDFAREHDLHIILGKTTEVPASAAARQRPLALGRQSLAAAPPRVVSDEDVRERLQLWSRYADDLIVGVFFLHDDAFYIHVSAERQRHLYAIAKDVVPSWFVFGMIGEFGFSASDEEVDRYFDPESFDHLIMLMYPLNVGEVTGMPLDNINSADPDADMRAYVQRYITHMGDKFIRRLKKNQLTVLVIQSFSYDGEPAGHVPREADVGIEASLGSNLLREIPGQESNYALAYFLWDGSRGGMSGLWQRAEWMSAAEQANRIDAERSDGDRQRAPVVLN